MSGRYEGQGNYKRTAAQLEHIAKAKKSVWGIGGRFIPLPAASVVLTSWWAEAKTDDEFIEQHQANLSRILNTQARTVYRLPNEEP